MRIRTSAILFLSGLTAFGALGAFGACAAPLETVDPEDEEEEDDSSSTTGTMTPSACSTFAASLCAKIETCMPFSLQAGFGDAAGCKKRYMLSCSATLNAPGTSYTTARVTSCATAIEGVACEALPERLAEPCDLEAGTLADGDACIDNNQCESTYCKPVSEEGCGECAPRLTAGASCLNDPNACPPSTKCGETCVTPVNQGSSCSSFMPCASGLTCFEGLCQKPLGKGASCSGGAPCDLNNWLFCSETTFLCEEAKIAAAGQACGATVDGMTVCPAGGLCDTFTNTCLAAVADGQACTGLSGDPPCMWPATCVEGVCKVRDTVSCGGGGTDGGTDGGGASSSGG